MRRIFLIVGILLTTVAVGTYFVVTSVPLVERTAVDQRGDVVAVEMTTMQWRFDVVGVSPTSSAGFSSTPPTGKFANTTITVHKGDTVILRIRNLDVPHGFALEEFGVNTATPPGQVTEVRFVAGKEGSFTFFCTVFCGTGHPNHKGTLIVEG